MKPINLLLIFGIGAVIVYYLKSDNNADYLEGGYADEYTSNEYFDPDQISKGIKVEMEHTNNPVIAAEIARDHLVERPYYYNKLLKAGL